MDHLNALGSSLNSAGDFSGMEEFMTGDTSWMNDSSFSVLELCTHHHVSENPYPPIDPASSLPLDLAHCEPHCTHDHHHHHHHAKSAAVTIPQGGPGAGGGGNGNPGNSNFGGTSLQAHQTNGGGPFLDFPATAADLTLPSTSGRNATTAAQPHNHAICR